MINTTDGPVPRVVHDSERRTINTSAVTEENLEYEDEAPGVTDFVAAPGWWAMYLDEGEDTTRAEPLAMWAVTDAGIAYGVILGEVGLDGTLDASKSAADYMGFVGYSKV